MKAKWLVENFLNDSITKELIEEIKAQGHYVKVAGVTNHFEWNVNEFHDGDCVIFHGSIQMGDAAVKELPQCYPVCWNNKEAYRCWNYYPVFQDYLFNDRHAFVSYGALIHSIWAYWGRFGKECMMFIRSDSGDKVLTGGLHDLQDIQRFKERNKHLHPDTMLVVSTPKKINGEWRFIVRSDTQSIIAESTYQFQGQKCLIPSAPFGARSLASRLAKVRYNPDPVYCIDICEDADGKYWLMEINSFCAAGIYAANQKEIVSQVSEVAEFEWSKRCSPSS